VCLNHWPAKNNSKVSSKNFNALTAFFNNDDRQFSIIFFKGMESRWPFRKNIRFYICENDDKTTCAHQKDKNWSRLSVALKKATLNWSKASFFARILMLFSKGDWWGTIFFRFRWMFFSENLLENFN
jgi:hypothetical protein